MKLTRLLALFALLAGLSLTVPLRAQPSLSAENQRKYIHALTLADRVRVAIYLEDDLTTTARIDARGKINLPLVGEITIGGLSVTQAQEAIQNAYREGRYLRAPQVTVSVEDYAPREVSIQGQIRNPGRYALPIESTFTVVELVTKAGGVTDIGKGTAVSVTRISADGTKKVFVVDVENAIKGKKAEKIDDNTLLLQPGDIVYIPERLI